MDKLVYTAASGLKAHLASQAAIANNMANASTIGFRADRVVFDRLSLQGSDFDTRTPASAEVVDADRKAGTIQQTGRPLDVAVASDSWLTVQATDGTEAYTRRGDLEIAPSGVLQTGDGFPVIGSGGPITIPPAQSVSISQSGEISIIPIGGDIKNPQVIDTLKIASAKGSDTVKGTDNLLYVRGGGVLPADVDAKIESGALEGSNVNMTQALVDMIENQRSYEVQANLMKSAKDMDESSASLMRLPS
ncbi:MULTISPECIES: flagellar basal body rod protein FlgF [Sphingomonas]|uniref:Flagellar basal-body rod protein FlgF n=1 Tax=Sphingomonas glacialis TaxID=658225 RepID=A0ABQ3LP38_9SPHN|nr:MULTISPECIES: flagellar basal body rod protein FlgF [Sphingomonas]MDY7523590.1 flagellar basal body rod protein FlgF [Sphingomonas sp. 10B4]MEB0282865.1 flagellar basal body rod protein FlgF [Sphingomonas sp. 10B4]GHH21866.1 flagellar basal-body rod protein FlgF [Sphingomonas glacialis]